jgi:DNA-binding transcriptional LysR family regulator
MDRAAEMRVFVRVVDRGSFSAAAEDLGMTPSAVSKVISRLEDRLGIRLLHRTTRRLALTPEGETYHVRAQDILAAIDDADAEVARLGTTPRGRLRVNTGTAFALHELVAALPDFMARYPEIEIDLSVTDRIVDLLAENADVAIRTGPVTDSSLVVRKIADAVRGLFAAPSYVDRRGTPAVPDDLVQHDAIVVSSVPAVNRWPFRHGDGVRIVEVKSKIVVDDAEVALRLAIAGAGILRVSDVLVGEAVRRGLLVPLFVDEHVSEALPVSAAYPQGRHRQAKVRAFVDFVVERFKSAPWRQWHARLPEKDAW